MNKFYTPHLDEFRDGVEYYLDGVKEEFQLKDNDLSTNLDNTLVQIKYLDVEDILSLDFDLFGESYETKVFRKYLESTKSSSYVELILTRIGDVPIISIEADNEHILATCICKNKFELEFILNRLRL